MGRWIRGVAVVSLLLLSSGTSRAQTSESGAEIPLDGKTDESLHEVGRQAFNPVAPLWQLVFDHALTGLGGGGLDGIEPAFTASFEPQGPLWQGRPGLGRFQWAEDFGVFARLTLPYVETVPVPRVGGGDDRDTGFGDIQLGAIAGPKRRSGFVWGVGPTFVFPTASDDALGQGKWQAGPAAVVGYMGSRWTAYALAQQWWSFAGDRHRPDTNQFSLNYVLVRSLPRQWQIGMQPTMTVDWTASKDDAVSFPIGLGVGRTVRIGTVPVQLWLEADYYAVRPDGLPGPRWGIDLQISPAIAALF